MTIAAPLTRHACLDDLTDTERSQHELGDASLEAFRELRDSGYSAADVFIFTHRTEGHVWQIKMSKTASSPSGFRFAAFHQPPLCSPQCRAAFYELLVTAKFHIVYEVIADHITYIANHDSGVCEVCEDI